MTSAPPATRPPWSATTGRGAGRRDLHATAPTSARAARPSRTPRTGGTRSAPPPGTLLDRTSVRGRGHRGGLVLRPDDGRGAARRRRSAGAAGDHLGRHPLGGPDRHAGGAGRDGGGATRSPGTGSTRRTRCPRSCGSATRSRRSSAGATTVVLAKDFVAYRLTGVLATDPSDASSTNAYDQAAGTWSAELIEAADLPALAVPRHRRRRPPWSAGSPPTPPGPPGWSRERRW